MEEPIFEFNTSLPKSDQKHTSSLLTGKIDDEDDDCNALNDETFGADAVEEDWESDHEKLAAEIEGRGTNLLADGSFLQNDDKISNVDHTDYIVERSVKNWVLDDDLDDPAIMRHSDVVSKRSVSETIKSIFSRTSPLPPALISDKTGSPITDGVWTSPERYGSTATNQDHLVMQLQKSNAHHVTFGQGYITPVDLPKHIGPFNNSIQKIHPNAKTLEELENDMFKPEPSHTSLTSGIRTVEDVERDIYLKPKAKTLNEIELEGGQRPPPPSPGGIDLPSIPGHNLGSQFPIGTPQSIHHQFSTPQTQMRPPMMNQNVSLPIMSGSSPQFPRFVDMKSQSMQYLPGQQQQQQHMVNGNINRNLRMMAPNRQFNGVPVPHPLLNNIRTPIRHPQHVSPHMLPPPGMLPNDIRGFPQFNHLQGPGQMRTNMNYIQNEMEEAPTSDDPNADPYAGLMTQREKEWLIKIQLMQLQSDNPYLDDFYYMSYRMKQMAKENASQDSSNSSKGSSKLVLPETGKIEQRQYTPTQYQGSLGKIQVMSVNNPRKMIDKIEKNSEDDEEAKKIANKELRRYRRGMVDIEKLYDILLEFDDIEKKMLALPADAHGPHIEQRALLLSKFYDSLSVPSSSEKLLFFMSVRKGKRLIVRVFPLLKKDQQLVILIVILQNIITILKRDQVDQVLKDSVHDMETLINGVDFLELMKLSHSFEANSIENNDLKNKSISPVIQSKFGTAVILCMLNRAEVLFKTQSVEVNLELEWSNFVICVYKRMIKTPLDAIATCAFSCPEVLNHFQRFSTNDSELAIVCNKLSQVMSLKKENSGQ